MSTVVPRPTQQEESYILEVLTGNTYCTPVKVTVKYVRPPPFEYIGTRNASTSFRHRTTLPFVNYKRSLKRRVFLVKNDLLTRFVYKY